MRQADRRSSRAPRRRSWRSPANEPSHARQVADRLHGERKRAETGYDKKTLRKLDRLPTNLPNPLAIASMAIQFVGRDPSVLLVSEGLGNKRWHGRVAILINEHTVSAGEMIAAFASENGLAKLVGNGNCR